MLVESGDNGLDSVLDNVKDAKSIGLTLSVSSLDRGIGAHGSRDINYTNNV